MSRIKDKFEEGQTVMGKDPMSTVTSNLVKLFKTPVALAMVYKLAVTAGYAQCRVECLFSALTRVDINNLHIAKRTWHICILNKRLLEKSRLRNLLWSGKKA